MLMIQNGGVKRMPILSYPGETEFGSHQRLTEVTGKCNPLSSTIAGQPAGRVVPAALAATAERESARRRPPGGGAEIFNRN